MPKSKFLLPLTLIFSSCWFFGTILIDFFIVPSVFQIIEDFFNAGELGIRVFSVFNNVELIFGTILVLISIKTKRLPLIFLSVTLCLIALFYFGFLSPKIAELTALWKASGDIIANGRDYQQEHQFFHKLYIGTDSVKLLLLATLLSLGLFKQEWFQ